MTLADRITRLPRAYDPQKGQEAVASLGLAGGALADLIGGAAGSSPFLCDCLQKEKEWIGEALTQPPEKSFDALLNEQNAESVRDVATSLRIAKRRAALLIGLADLGGVWDVEAVTAALTRLADHAVAVAAKVAIGAEIRRGKLPGKTEADLDHCAGFFALAMGKMGARELNYSSDIDLIFLYDNESFGADAQDSARQSFVRAARQITKILSERTGDGYVFRTDLRLRPDASVTPVVLAAEAAERYYESLGRTWERAAYIKARAMAGDLEAGEGFLDTLRPFIWRKHLDFAAIQDAHDIRLRIRDTKGLHKAPSYLDYDVKLGAGGIRDIEFFTQTRQLIAGGRDPELRHRKTLDALHALARANWVSESEAETLSRDYLELREIEHRLQMVADQQTHLLPCSEEEFERLACLSGRDGKDLRTEIVQRFERVQNITSEFFAPGVKVKQPDFDLPEELATIVDRWPSYPALRSDRAVEIFGRVRPVLLKRVLASPRPDVAMVHIDAFLAGLPAGVQLFSLFEANPNLLDLIVDIAESAPGLAQYLGRSPGVLDAVMSGGFFAPWPSLQELTADLRKAVESASDYEARLDAGRRWQKEWHFRIGVHVLRGLIDADTAARQYADLADVTVQQIFPEVIENFSKRHGAPPGQGAAVLAMGSLGAGRLGPTSDLDLIVIYDAQGQDRSDGARPLATPTYFARLTQALVTGLSAPMAQGRLYEVDMRLRPSGRQGPVATSLQAFENYQLTDAWTWEHLALSRARVVVGSSELSDAIESVREAVMDKACDRQKVISDVSAMRVRLAEAKGTEGPFDAKNGPGRLMDIELIAATGALLDGATGRDVRAQITATAGVLDIQAEPLIETVDFYRRVVIGQALVRDTATTKLDMGMEQSLAKFAGEASPDALSQKLDRVADRTKLALDAALKLNV